MISAVITCITIVLLIYWYFTVKFNYWRNLNVPYIVPKIPLGNLQTPGHRRLHSSHLMQKFYHELKGQGLFGGIYFFVTPVVLALDLEFIKNVLIRDFHYFEERGVYYNERDDPLSAHLFALNGQKWRTLRSKLSPTFTSGKIKYMFQTVVEVADQLRDCIRAKLNDGTTSDIEFKDILARFTVDVIGSCAFGIECNSLMNPDAEFRRMGHRAFLVSRFKQTFMVSFKRLAHFFRMKTLNQDVAKFFMQIVKETIEYREQNNIKRNDFLDLLIQLKNTGNINGCAENPNGKLTINEIAAQSFIFFLAGFETSSTALMYCLYELSVNLDIQNKARTEIKSILPKYGGKITYECCMEMHYVEQIIYETLRKYPPGNLFRMVTNDYKVRNTNIILRKGTFVILPIYAVQNDPEFYPNPSEFNPDRFQSENDSRPLDIHFTFGAGPRNCIGMRFGMIEMKIALTTLINNFQFYLSEKTNYPIVFSTLHPILMPDGPQYLRVEMVR